MRVGPRRGPARRSERGAVAGAEVLVICVALLLGGSLAVASTWSVVETRVALDAAAREYLRSYTRAEDPLSAAARADAALRSSLAERGTPLRDVRVDGPDPSTFGPCAVARVVLTVATGAIRAPLVGRLGPSEVSVTHSELVDPHREMAPGPAYSWGETDCGGS